MSDTSTSHQPHAVAVKFTMLLAGTVFLLMMILGLLMRSAQGNLIHMEPELFYQVLTAHGAGMVGAAALSGAAILWYFIARYVPLLISVYWAFIGLFLLGVVLILGSIFIGGFAGAWTFLFPLPAMSGGAWNATAAATFILGYTSIGVGFLLYYLEVGRKLIAAYGGISGALGWPLAFGGGSAENAPPPAVIAAMATTIFNVIGIVVGATVLVSSLVHLLVPGFAVDALLAKNMIYFFGHVFINASIYMAVIAVYEIIPKYTGKAWKASRVFVLSWNAVLLLVMAVYPHHLLQDLVMPSWALVMGQIVSYLSGIPLLAVTAFSLLYYLRSAKVEWDLASALLVLGVAGWSIGSVPAIIDGMIVVNKVMHNTQWVPGHFHIYLILGEVAMSFGFMAWLVKDSSRQTLDGLDRAAFGAYVLGGIGFTAMFLVSGALSVPRRWAVHIPEWFLQNRLASFFAALIIVSVVMFIIRFGLGISRRSRAHGSAS